ncbi:MAG TPA: glycosyltransferase family 2 protein [Gammaproteobacteria bacterium]
MLKITGVVITFNEAAHIRACIESLRQVCNEIIVVDSYSRDETVKLAQEAGAIVYQREYPGDGPQINYGAARAGNDWILRMDADERLEADAADFIRSLDLDQTTQAYAFCRKNFVGSRWIKAAGFYPEYVTRLYRRSQCSFTESGRHDYVKSRSIKKVNAHIIHYTYRNYSNWIDKLNKLTDIDARLMYEHGIRTHRWAPVTHALAAAIRKFLLKGGLFQGLDGITVSLTTVFRIYMKYLKLYELQQNAQDRG